jgi:hypothetical protein
MSWKLVTTVSLDRRTRKLLARHPDLRPRFADTLEKLPTDPFAPGLRLHPLTGKLQGMQAVGLADSCGSLSPCKSPSMKSCCSKSAATTRCMAEARQPDAVFDQN